jgi:LEA14-like dessication related protein
MSMSRVLRLGLLAGAAFTATACASFFPPPTVAIVGVELVSLGLTSGTAAVTLDVTNEGSRAMDLLGMLYELEVQGHGTEAGWTRLAGGTHAQEVELPGGATRRVTVPVPFEYKALGAALQSFLARGEVPYRVQGEVSVKGLGMTFDVPFRSQGVLEP